MAIYFKDEYSLTLRNSLKIWNVIKEIYKDSSNSLTWSILLMTDSDISFWSVFA